MPKKILVVGANFVNRGAQSMLFIVTDELKKRFDGCEVYFACNGEKYREKEFVFKRVLYTKVTQSIALGERVDRIIMLRRFVINVAKLFLQASLDLFKLHEADKLAPELDLIVDVSGYALADISTPLEHEYYLDNIRLAQRYDIPIILFPQSFGPFNYNKKDDHLVEEMRDLLKYPKVIYAREQQGRDLLEKSFGLNNVRLSPDLVLQNRSIIRENVCTSMYEVRLPDITTLHNVAVIPNYHCFTDKYRKHSFDLYKRIIETLINAGKEIYVFSHASFDAQICRDIAKMFDKNEHFHLLEEEFDCIEYDRLIRDFEFIICSRYHGCVHAYRNHVPNIILGWALKYRELAKLLGQEKYIYNILSDECRDEDILDAVDAMLADHADEARTIADRLNNIQSETCFDVLDQIDL